jgi:hypothetical protein
MNASDRKDAKKQDGQGQQQEAASGTGQQYGEGNYQATRDYNEGVKDHLQNHDVEREARDAAPRSADEAKEMQDAEALGKSRAGGMNDRADTMKDTPQRPKK